MIWQPFGRKVAWTLLYWLPQIQRYTAAVKVHRRKRIVPYCISNTAFSNQFRPWTHNDFQIFLALALVLWGTCKTSLCFRILYAHLWGCWGRERNNPSSGPAGRPAALRLAQAGVCPCSSRLSVAHHNPDIFATSSNWLSCTTKHSKTTGIQGCHQFVTPIR